MISKPEKVIKRIIKAVGERQAVFVIGDWQEEFIKGIKGIKEKQNSITQSSGLSFEDNSFTRIIADYSLKVFDDEHQFFNEVRRLLLPTGMLIISANCEDSILDEFLNLFRKDYIKECATKKIKPKLLQDQIHDHGFLIDGYYGYPGGHLLMMAQIQNKEVTTLFRAERQETITNKS
ncbi:MAG: methyltransferase domain-containing protein [Candidatus Melainabacteria bacterium]|nr:methyltransferase domain-containing protein [Candidatus Melainabacteria bacterium]